MTDIVERLRESAKAGTYDGSGRAANAKCTDLTEAADEIELLREWIKDMQDYIKKMGWKDFENAMANIVDAQQGSEQ